jgi:AAA15 family ATPase/GTPase
MSKYLHGIYLQYYRGIGPEAQFLTDFQDFNFFIGANNAGKSTILDFIRKYLRTAEGGKRRRPDELDIYRVNRQPRPLLVSEFRKRSS